LRTLSPLGCKGWIRNAGSFAAVCSISEKHGAENVSPMEDAEAQLLQTGGIVEAMSADGSPLIRLACHARPETDATFVI